MVLTCSRIVRLWSEWGHSKPRTSMRSTDWQIGLTPKAGGRSPRPGHALTCVVTRRTLRDLPDLAVMVLTCSRIVRPWSESGHSKPRTSGHSPDQGAGRTKDQGPRTNDQGPTPLTFSGTRSNTWCTDPEQNWSHIADTSRELSGPTDPHTWHCNFPRECHICWTCCPQKRSYPAQPKRAATSYWEGRLPHASSHKPTGIRSTKSSCTPGQCCRSRPLRARAQGNRNWRRPQNLPVRAHRRSPGLRTKIRHTANWSCAWPRCTKRCYRRARRRMSCASPRRHAVCRQEQAELPDSDAMIRLAPRMSCPAVSSEPAKSLQNCPPM